MGMLKDDHPELAKEWNRARNAKNGLSFEEVTSMSIKKAWWKCFKCGYEWETQISVRSKGHGCPACAHARTGAANAVTKDESRRLTNFFPDVTKTWDYEHNGELRPEAVSCMSNKKAWWVCSECGKKWESQIYSRVRSKTTTCRACSVKNADRNFLKPGINDLATFSPKAASEWDYSKNGAKTPHDVTAHSEEQYWWKCKNGHEWKAKILSRTRDGYRGCPYCSHRRVMSGESDLATVKPKLAKLWHPQKNKISPRDVTASTNTKYWWKCKKGHEWIGSPNNMSNETECPYCSGAKALAGFNDLATLCPDLIKEWDYAKNGPIDPRDFTPGSGKKVWWKCPSCGHEWRAQIIARSQGHSCPVCTNRVAKKGVNDLKTTNPTLAMEWNYEKNGDLRPEDVVAGSAINVWWKCKNGHEWKATIVSRNKGHHCPKCDASKHTSVSEKAIAYYLKKCGIVVEENKRIGRKELDIYIPSMGVAIEYDGSYYHKDKNKDLNKNRLCKKLGIKLIRVREPGLPKLNSTSVDVQIGCIENDYSHLDAAIQSVLSVLNIKFDDVDVRRDLHGIYSLFELAEKAESIKNSYPILAKEWDYEKNTIDINKVSKGMHVKVWWICSKCGYSYEAMVYQRCSSGSGCPRCAHRENVKKPEKLNRGINDLATLRPDLAKEWNYEKNSLSPSDVTCGMSGKFWWRCPLGHSYNSAVTNRVQGNGCPYCANKKVLPGFNDLATLKPEIAQEWNYQKNGKLKPENILAGSGKKIWWKCSKCGKEWEATPGLRKNSNCKTCNLKKANMRVVKGVDDLCTIKPEIAKEWNYEKNGDLKPEDISANSGRRVWWKCSKCGAEWITAPYARKNANCRSCNRLKRNIKKKG